MKICSIENCLKPHRAKGFCSTHYARWAKYGDPTVKFRSPKLIWLDKAIASATPNDCLIWPFNRDKDGYALVSVKSSPKRVHRIVCEIQCGAADSSLLALHSCGKGHEGCINPHHLRWGNQSENMWDRVSHATLRGEPRSARAKLTPQQVLEIRRRLNSGEGRKQISEAFGMSLSAIHDIALGRSWSFLEDAA